MSDFTELSEMSNYREPTSFDVCEGGTATDHDELIQELRDFDVRISDLEGRLSKALDNIDLLGQAVAELIRVVDPNFNPDQQ